MLLQAYCPLTRVWRQVRRRLEQYRPGQVGIWCVLLAGMVVTGCASPVRAVPTPTPWPTPVLSVQQTYVVETGSMIDQFSLLGEVVPARWAPLAFPVAGDLGAIHVQWGETVEADALLAELAMPELKDELEQARLTLAQAQAALAVDDNRQQFALERAQLALRRAEVLLAQAQEADDPVQISLQQIELEEAELDVREAESQTDPTLAQEVVKAEMIVDSLERQVAERQLRAPFAGQIVAIGVDLSSLRNTGTLPTPGAAIAANSPLMVIAQPEPIEIIIPAESARAAELEIGQVVTVTHRWAQEPFRARVDALPARSLGPDFVPGFPTAIHLTPLAPAPSIPVGEPVTVAVVAATREETLVLPDAAVRRFAGRTFVVLQDGDRQRRVDVRVGLESNGLVEIVDGLQAGDVVSGR
jgi:membrane fusion protein, macrolide-specific efflux system